MRSFVRYCTILGVVTGWVIAMPARAQKGFAAYYDLELPDTAVLGGPVTLSHVPPHFTQTFEVTTRAGDTPASVAKRLVELANANADFGRVNVCELTATGVKIQDLKDHAGCGMHVLGGSGLTLPPTPTSLSVSYDFKEDRLMISWDNGAFPYTSVATPQNGLPSAAWPGDTTNLPCVGVSEHPMIYPLNDMIVAVVGYQDKTPSNAGVMRLRGARQEEVYVLPFTNGVTPNWLPWRGLVEQATVLFEEGRHEASKPERYQVLRAAATEADSRYTIGLSRKFFDLQPGAHYRLGMRTRFAPGPNTAAQWSVSTLPVAERQQALTSEQFAAAQLPATGRRLFTQAAGPQHGAKWVTYQTGAGDVEDIVMPDGCQTLLVWVRLEGHGAGASALSFDGVFLEKLPSARPE